jgi:hypothetical protein
MADSEHIQSLPMARRLLLASAGLLAAAPAAALAAAVPACPPQAGAGGAADCPASVVASPDARLLALVAEWEPLRAEYLVLGAADGARPDAEWQHEARRDELLAATEQIESELCDMPARTLPGIIAKAKVLRSFVPLGLGDAGPPDYADAHVWTTWTLCNDLLALIDVPASGVA